MRVDGKPGQGFTVELNGLDDVPKDFTEREEKVRAEFWDKLKRFAGRIPFAEDLVAAYYCALDPETPLRVRGTLLGALAYFILPIDVVPDFILGVGFTDDAAVIAMAVRLVSQHILPKHRVAAARALGKGANHDMAVGL